MVTGRVGKIWWQKIESRLHYKAAQPAALVSPLKVGFELAAGCTLDDHAELGNPQRECSGDALEDGHHAEHLWGGGRWGCSLSDVPSVSRDVPSSSGR